VPKTLRVAVVAEESAGVQVLQQLAALQPDLAIAAVLTGQTGGPHSKPLVREAAQRLGLDTWPAELVQFPELADRLRQANVDILVNVHSLFILHPEVVAAPAIGSFNLHPGPLPGYAGLNAPSWAVYNGENEHAVTLHWMDDGIDTGPLAWTESFGLTDTDTGLSVSGKCVRHGIPLVLRLVQTALDDKKLIPRHEQDRSKRRYFPTGPPREGRIDWGLPAREILRFVRASDYAPFPSPWPHPQAELAGVRAGIARAAPTGATSTEQPGTVRAVTDSGAAVATADEIVIVQKLWLDGRYRKPLEVLPH
jgi:methionyl-tRNA formyltransferase